MWKIDLVMRVSKVEEMQGHTSEVIGLGYCMLQIFIKVPISGESRQNRIPVLA